MGLHPQAVMDAKCVCWFKKQISKLMKKKLKVLEVSLPSV